MAWVEARHRRKWGVEKGVSLGCVRVKCPIPRISLEYCIKHEFHVYHSVLEIFNFPGHHNAIHCTRIDKWNPREIRNNKPCKFGNASIRPKFLSSAVVISFKISSTPLPSLKAQRQIRIDTSLFSNVHKLLVFMEAFCAFRFCRKNKTLYTIVWV